MGVDWSLREGYAWAEDKEHCEEYGRMLQADPNKVSSKAKKRGLPQVSQQPLRPPPFRMFETYSDVVSSVLVSSSCCSESGLEVCAGSEVVATPVGLLIQ